MSVGAIAAVLHPDAPSPPFWRWLTSDVGYAARSWVEDILPGLTNDDAEAEASLAWVREFADQDDCLAAIASHDPDTAAGTVSV